MTSLPAAFFCYFSLIILLLLSSSTAPTQICAEQIGISRFGSLKSNISLSAAQDDFLVDITATVVADNNVTASSGVTLLLAAGKSSKTSAFTFAFVQLSANGRQFASVASAAITYAAGAGAVRQLANINNTHAIGVTLSGTVACLSWLTQAVVASHTHSPALVDPILLIASPSQASSSSSTAIIFIAANFTVAAPATTAGVARIDDATMQADDATRVIFSAGGNAVSTATCATTNQTHALLGTDDSRLVLVQLLDPSSGDVSLSFQGEQALPLDGACSVAVTDGGSSNSFALFASRAFNSTTNTTKAIRVAWTASGGGVAPDAEIFINTTTGGVAAATSNGSAVILLYSSDSSALLAFSPFEIVSFSSTLTAANATTVGATLAFTNNSNGDAVFVTDSGGEFAVLAPTRNFTLTADPNAISGPFANASAINATVMPRQFRVAASVAVAGSFQSSIAAAWFVAHTTQEICDDVFEVSKYTAPSQTSGGSGASACALSIPPSSSQQQSLYSALLVANSSSSSGGGGSMMMVLEFAILSASPLKFLLPRHAEKSIVESLLANFIVVVAAGIRDDVFLHDSGAVSSAWPAPIVVNVTTTVADYQHRPNLWFKYSQDQPPQDLSVLQLAQVCTQWAALLSKDITIPTLFSPYEADALAYAMGEGEVGVGGWVDLRRTVAVSSSYCWRALSDQSTVASASCGSGCVVPPSSSGEVALAEKQLYGYCNSTCHMVNGLCDMFLSLSILIGESAVTQSEYTAILVRNSSGLLQVTLPTTVFKFKPFCMSLEDRLFSFRLQYRSTTTATSTTTSTTTTTASTTSTTTETGTTASGTTDATSSSSTAAATSSSSSPSSTTNSSTSSNSTSISSTTTEQTTTTTSGNGTTTTSPASTTTTTEPPSTMNNGTATSSSESTNTTTTTTTTPTNSTTTPNTSTSVSPSSSSSSSTSAATTTSATTLTSTTSNGTLASTATSATTSAAATTTAPASPTWVIPTLTPVTNAADGRIASSPSPTSFRIVADNSSVASAAAIFQQPCSIDAFLVSSSSSSSSLISRWLQKWQLTSVSGSSADALSVQVPAFSPASLVTALFGSDAHDALPLSVSASAWRPPTVVVNVSVGDWRCWADNATAQFLKQQLNASAAARRALTSVTLTLVGPQRAAASLTAVADSTVAAASSSSLVTGTVALSVTLASHGSRARVLLSLIECARPTAVGPEPFESFGVTHVRVGGGSSSDGSSGEEFVAAWLGAAVMNLVIILSLYVFGKLVACIVAVLFPQCTTAASSSSSSSTAASHAVPSYNSVPGVSQALAEAAMRHPGTVVIVVTAMFEFVAKQTTVAIAFGDSIQKIVGCVVAVALLAVLAGVGWRVRPENLHARMLHRRWDIAALETKHANMMLAELPAEQQLRERQSNLFVQEAMAEDKRIRDGNNNNSSSSSSGGVGSSGSSNTDGDEGADSWADFEWCDSRPHGALLLMLMQQHQLPIVNESATSGGEGRQQQNQQQVMNAAALLQRDEEENEQFVDEQNIDDDILLAVILEDEEDEQLQQQTRNQQQLQQQNSGSGGNEEDAEMERVGQASLDDPVDALCFVKRFRPVFAEYRRSRSWFLCLELVLSFCLGIVEGSRVNRATCAVSGIFYVFLLVGFLLVVVFLKPYLSTHTKWFVLAVLALQAVAGVTFLIGHYGGNAGAVEAAAIMAIAAAAIILLRAVVELFALIYSGLTHISSAAKRREIFTQKVQLARLVWRARTQRIEQDTLTSGAVQEMLGAPSARAAGTESDVSGAGGGAASSSSGGVDDSSAGAEDGVPLTKRQIREMRRRGVSEGDIAKEQHRRELARSRFHNVCIAADEQELAARPTRRSTGGVALLPLSPAAAPAARAPTTTASAPTAARNNTSVHLGLNRDTNDINDIWAELEASTSNVNNNSSSPSASAAAAVVNIDDVWAELGPPSPSSPPSPSASTPPAPASPMLADDSAADVGGGGGGAAAAASSPLQPHRFALGQQQRGGAAASSANASPKRALQLTDL